MKNDFAFIRGPGGHFQLITPHVDVQGTPDPIRHDISRLEAESLVEEMVQALGGWIRETRACRCDPSKGPCHD